MFRIKFISLFLAFTMSIQMLPLVQIGVALSTNQWTEELPHSHGNTEDSGKNDCNINKFLLTSGENFRSGTIENTSDIFIHTSEQTPSNHSTDIVSPPPDVMA